MTSCLSVICNCPACIMERVFEHVHVYAASFSEEQEERPSQLNKKAHLTRKGRQGMVVHCVALLRRERYTC